MLALVAGVGGRLEAQTTTGGITGVVADSSGTPVADATIVVTNTATGLQRTVAVRPNGSYNLPGLEPGNSYRVAARAIGYQPVLRENVVVRLSQSSRVDFTLARQVVQLQEVTATAPTGTEAEFSPDRQGAQTTITEKQLSSLPTMDRDFTDFVKLAPQVQVREGEGGISAAGQNNRFNTVQVDGATVNDRFGLGRTGQAGGQADGRSVGLEAVKEYQILLSPYDVRQGNFTGALINAVTKSGTNELHGSLYGTHRENSWAGFPVDQAEFKNWQYGGSLGGPIIKDRAHFFLNLERRDETQPAAGPYLGGPLPIAATQADVDAFNAAAKAKGLAGNGTLDLISNKRPLTNALGRIDYQLGANSRLVAKMQFNSANRDVFSRTTSATNPTLELSNNGYFFDNKTYNPSLQFITNFANGASNELIASANIIRDSRTPNVLEPLVVVQNFTAAGSPAPCGAPGGQCFSIRSGSEEFSQGNVLSQDIYELTNNLTLPVGRHNFTLGARWEGYKVRNLFAQNSYGTFQFDNLADFEAGNVEQYTIRVALPGTPGGDTRFRAGQFALYAQDDWDLSPTFTVSPGVRVDMPYFTTALNYDPRVIARFGEQKKPGGQLMVSPRLGFNWTDASLSTNQIRGGVGVFTGAPAFVWYSNAYANNGLGLVGLQCGGNGGVGGSGAPPVFNPDNVTNPTTACANGATVGAGGSIGEVDLIGQNTKFPQVLRANLAFDRALGGGVIGTLEGLYTKDLNNFFIVNRNLAAPAGTDVNGRVVYGTVAAGTGIPTTNFVDPIYAGSSGGVYELRNTSQGYNWSVTGQLRKSFGRDLQASVGYTYSESYDVQSFTSSRAVSNWRLSTIRAAADTVDQRTRSSFDRPHRVIANATYTLRWKLPTDISFTYVGQSGSPYTLITGGSSNRGDLNRNGNTGDDPIYIPTGVGDPKGPVFSSAAQELAFNEYIDGEACLRSQRGQLMQRNSCRNPWQNQLDMSIRQNLPVLNGNASFDLQIFNVLRMLDKDWGLVKTVNGDEFYTAQILNVTGATSEADAAQRRAVVTFDPKFLDQRFRPVSSGASINRSAYYIQAGIRYAF
ncbi:MAG TPA: carboxypeptidase regulatory-like domain-containing protein [Gemmatimonadales bacterium]|nr:carboxypeptidase regulatory-like domain-containing protein [Gemmatimonadales bacterium]